MTRSALFAALLLLAQDPKPPPPVKVVVRCDAPEAVKGERLIAHRFAKPDDEYGTTVPLEARFGGDGSCEAKLEPGLYAFEALAVRDRRRIVALRSKPLRVQESTVVHLRSAGPATLTVRHESAALALQRVAIRSLSDWGEAAWTADGAAPEKIEALLSPHMTYRVSVRAKGERAALAVWDRRETAGSWTWTTRHEALHEATFAWRPDTPVRTSSEATFHFADGPFTIANPEKTVFYTNRRYAKMSYRYDLESNRRQGWHPRPYVLEKKHRFMLGGPVRVFGWVGTINVSTDRLHQQFVWGSSTQDPNGHEFDPDFSTGPIGHGVRLANGDPIPPGLMSPENWKIYGDLDENLRVTVKCPILEKGEATVIPDHFGLLVSDHFRIWVPANWETQGRMYLEKLERVHAALRKATGWGGPGVVHVLWHMTPENAKGQIGGWDSWIDMPFGALGGTHLHDGLPEHMVHEMAHTFGFDHSPEMGRADWLAHQELGKWPWFLIDHPEYEPLSRIGWDMNMMIRPLFLRPGNKQGEAAALVADFKNVTRVDVAEFKAVLKYFDKEGKFLREEPFQGPAIPALGTVTRGVVLRDVPGSVRHEIEIRGVTVKGR